MSDSVVRGGRFFYDGFRPFLCHVRLARRSLWGFAKGDLKPRVFELDIDESIEEAAFGTRNSLVDARFRFICPGMSGHGRSGHLRTDAIATDDRCFGAQS